MIISRPEVATTAPYDGRDVQGAFDAP
jgi:hypothetical protein